MKKPKPHNVQFGMQSALVLFAQFLPTIKSFLLFPLFVNFLGTAAYGTYAQIIALIGFVSPLGILGLNISIKRFFPGEKDRKSVRNDFWLVWCIVLGNSIILGLLLYLARGFIFSAFFEGITQETLLFLGIISLPLSNLYVLLLDYFVAFGRSLLFATMVILKNGAELLLTLFLLFTGKGLVAILLVMAASLFLSILLSTILVLQQLPFQIPKFSPARLKQYLGVGFPLFLSGFSYWIMGSSDRLLIGYFLNLEQVGVYSGIYNVANIAMILGSVAFFGVLPLFSYFWNQKKKREIQRAFTSFFNYYWALSVPCFFGLLLIGKELLLLLANQDFLPYAYLLPLLFMGLMVFYGLAFYDYVFILNNKSKVILQWTIITALLNILINLLLIPIYGIFGAAIATVIAYLTYSFFIYIRAQELMRIPQQYPTIGKTVVAAAIMYGIAYYAKQWYPLVSFPALMLYVLGAGALYTILLFLFRIPQAIELKYLKRVFTR